MQAYSNPKRESDPHALPDVEVFYFNGCTAACVDDSCPHDPAGWYWQACFPGCLPDGEPNGPFATQEEALADAREGLSEEEEDQ